MKKEIDKLNGCYDIYSNGRYVVLAGTKLRVFNTDGSQIICRDDIRYPGRITFLSNNRMMLSTGNGVIHLIDLVTGKDIWSVQGPKQILILFILQLPQMNHVPIHLEQKGKNCSLYELIYELVKWIVIM